MTKRGRPSSHLHVVLLAGGSGTRFWPLSRSRRPKQFLALGGPTALIDAAWRRALRLAPVDRIWAVVPQALAGRLARTLPRLKASSVIAEPSPRDTAPAIALACATIARRDPEAIVAVFPTDHVVRDTKAFVRAVRRAQREAEAGSLVCLGVKPDRPATGFGYLRCARAPSGVEALDVERFVEKPNAARARRFVRSGRYLWNGGMFVWGAQRFLEELARTAPTIRTAVARVVSGKRREWEGLPRVSVDYAVMEKARDVKVVPLDAGWDDVGSWDAAARLREARPPARDAHVLIDSPRSVVFDEVGLTAVVGVPDVVIVRSRDALLILARGRGEDVKRVVATLEDRGLGRLL